MNPQIAHGVRKSLLAQERAASAWLFVYDPQGPLGSVACACAPLPLSSGGFWGEWVPVLSSYLICLFIRSSTSIRPSVSSPCLHWCSLAQGIN